MVTDTHNYLASHNCCFMVDRVVEPLNLSFLQCPTYIDTENGAHYYINACKLFF